MSNHTKGQEREAFVDLLLKGCLPDSYRFGSGEITDPRGKISGQVDVVVEYPFFPSFPLLGTAQYRLYLVETVAVCIEVKSSVGQFDEAVKTMKKIRALDPACDWLEAKDKDKAHWFASLHGRGILTSFTNQVGVALVFFKGWATPSKVRQWCKTKRVDVFLQIDPPVFYARKYRESKSDKLVEGPGALAAFLLVITEHLRWLTDVQADIFRRYVDRKPPRIPPPKP